MMYYQTYRFLKAFEEYDGRIIDENSIVVDHKNMAIKYDNKFYRLLFPKSYVEKINDIGFEKSIEYNFVGQYTDKRKWILSYKDKPNTYIDFNERGRSKEKGWFDEEYFNILCKSKFTLCPIGDHSWTYRFYEALMCKSIPVVYRRGEFLDYGRFMYFTNTCDHIYDTSYVTHNYDVFNATHTLNT